MSIYQSVKVIGIVTALAVPVYLSGCAAASVAIAKKDLDVQTKMSDTIFLDPVSPDKKVVFIQIRNTSDKQNFDIETPIKQAIVAKGYRITQDPEAAHFRLQANVLSVTKASPTAAEAALHNGYGGAIVAGAVAGGAIDRSYRGAAIGGLLGGAASLIADNAVKDVTFMAITDIQLSEKARKGVMIRQDNKQDAKQGIGGSQRQTSSEVTNRKKYRSRVVSTANKVNLEYAEAAPLLTSGLTRSLSGLF